MVYKMISISRTCVIFKKGWNLSDAQKRIYVLKNSRLEPAIFANIRKTNGYTKFHSNYCKFSNLGQNGLSWQGLHHTTCIYIQASRGTSRKMSPPTACARPWLRCFHIHVLHADSAHLAIVRECMDDLAKVIFAAVDDMLLQTCHSDKGLIMVRRIFESKVQNDRN